MGPIRALSWSARRASDSTTGEHTTRRRDSTDALSPTETPERNTGKKHPTPRTRRYTPNPKALVPPTRCEYGYPWANLDILRATVETGVD
jgi:hypothetical protein